MKAREIFLTSRSDQDELVQSEALSTSFNDSRSCGFGESESSDGELGDIKNSDIVSHGTNNDGDSVSIITREQRLAIGNLNDVMTYFFSPRCLMSLEREMGGLLTFEAMSLLTTVFAKVEPVLLARNLNN